MSQGTSAETLDRLRAHLDVARDLRARSVLDHGAPAALARQAVRAFQAQRLRDTYADLLAQPRYRPAATFFLVDLYSTADQSARDRQLDRALPKLVRFLPAGSLEPIALALELDALAERLDGALAAQTAGSNKTLPVIDSQGYASAYRACANRTEREHQIKLVNEIGVALDTIARTRGVSTAVSLMRGPARAAGFDTLQSFLERGLGAFKHMGGAGEFLATVSARETAINNRLFDGHPDPFGIDL